MGENLGECGATLEWAGLPQDRRSPCAVPWRCGIPWPKGMSDAQAGWVLRDADGRTLPVQTEVLENWSDGTPRWVFCQGTDHPDQRWPLQLAARPRNENPTATVHQPNAHVEISDRLIAVQSAGVRFAFPRSSASGNSLFQAQTGVMAGYQLDLEIGLADRRLPRWGWDEVKVVKQGPCFTTVELRGAIRSATRGQWLCLRAVAEIGVAHPGMDLAVTLHNPRRARHQGGLWDMGQGGFLLLDDVRLRLHRPTTKRGAAPSWWCSPERDSPEKDQTGTEPLRLFQGSSGGAHEFSTNHKNRFGRIPVTQSGYRFQGAAETLTGRRATPAFILSEGDGPDERWGWTMPRFWEMFPKALEWDREGFRCVLYPKEFGDPMELQGGEQITHRMYWAWGPDLEQRLDHARNPCEHWVKVSPQWIAQSRAISDLTVGSLTTHPVYRELVDAALDPDVGFEAKREMIDEYGWRHFGDLYGDHEAVRHAGPEPLVSHVNNHYDVLAGYAIWYLRTGDPRWAVMMDDLARHLTDIDIYHTRGDKSAYNHGMFWHTEHYADADACGHRSFPRSGRGYGGGPAPEACYSWGLALHHVLTGSSASREAVRGLADWIHALDDGAQNVFGWLDRGRTGHATASGSPWYHGPGRSGACSIRTLLDAYELDRDERDLAKAEELIARCIGPGDDVPSLNLKDVERKWFYTIFFQSLARYLDVKHESGRRDAAYGYALAGLLHYASWMVREENPYLDRPEILEFPTETWAAQDMRKAEVFWHAARAASALEQGQAGWSSAQFWSCAETYFTASVRGLSGFSRRERTLARPVTLMMINGWPISHLMPIDIDVLRNAERSEGTVSTPELPESVRAELQLRAWPVAATPPPSRYPTRIPFVPQKVRAIRRFRRLVIAGLALALLAAAIAVYVWLFAASAR